MPAVPTLRCRHLLLIHAASNLRIRYSLTSECQDTVAHSSACSRFAESRIAQHGATQPDLSQSILSSRTDDPSFKFIDSSHHGSQQIAARCAAIYSEV